MNEDFALKLKLKVDETEDMLKCFLPTAHGSWSVIADAMNYSFLSGGKRLRPLIAMETYSLFGGNDSRVIEPLAAAIEMIHTYSLIHDDLPAMDNDDLRRGKPTNHKVYGEAMAILAGDGLLNFAFETAVKAFDACEDIETYKNVAKALEAIASFRGLNGMIGGQVVDLLTTEGKLPCDEATFRQMDELKTGALIECAFLTGALAAGADSEDTALVKRIAGKTGIAFQIRDDILDITGDEAVLGKPVGSDVKNGKKNLATILGLDKAEEEVVRLSDEACRELETIYERHDESDHFLSELVEYLTNREK